MAQHRPSSIVPHRWRRLRYGPTLLLHRRPTPAGERGIIDAAPAYLGGRNPKEQQRRASLGGQNPGYKRRASLGGQNPGDNNNDNAQISRVLSNDKGLPLEDKTLGTTTTTTPNLQGCVRTTKTLLRDNTPGTTNTTTKKTPNLQG